ncbi:purine-cytosine permease family protein [Asaia krungthepensis]|uniref:Purine-cytosine permease n=1 Tax=Asaia krungthepensis NRIC 0535 TaxID=1307925 RepID=A0ABQ0Q097_9PROT|nr:cytosine permease [Asaia krungthepensis]GBQ85949.1 purine-cytosine permease [Asaia krungthepensis NRIC 0535]
MSHALPTPLNLPPAGKNETRPMDDTLPLSIENETIFPVPEARRHGNAWSLFKVWVGANQNVMAVMTGLLYPGICHLSLGWSLLAILTGNIVGGVFMALHAAQGPHLGIPQMQQTRGQFGSTGSLLIIAVIIIMYVGFTTTFFAIGREEARSLFGSGFGQLPIWGTVLVTALLCMIGHDLIERFIAGFIPVASLAFLLVGLAYLDLAQGHLAQAIWATPALHDFLKALSLGVLWQIAYAPYVSDYTRYLPSSTGERTAFVVCLAGSVLGTAYPMVIGAFIGSTGFNGSMYDAVRPWGTILPAVLFLVVMISTLVSCTMQIYCAALSSLTFLQTFRQNWHPTGRARGMAALILLLICALITEMLSGDVLTILDNVIALLLAVLSPWTAINLVDYYLIRHGHYDMESLFRRDGGIYGTANRPALSCYALGVLVQIPFLSNGLYTGRIAHMLDGIDLSWILGIFVPGAFYWAWSRTRPCKR